MLVENRSLASPDPEDLHSYLIAKSLGRAIGRIAESRSQSLGRQRDLALFNHP